VCGVVPYPKRKPSCTGWGNSFDLREVWEYYEKTWTINSSGVILSSSWTRTSALSPDDTPNILFNEE